MVAGAETPRGEASGLRWIHRLADAGAQAFGRQTRVDACRLFFIWQSETISLPAFQRASLPGARDRWARQIDTGGSRLFTLCVKGDGDLACDRESWPGNACRARNGSALARL